MADSGLTRVRRLCFLQLKYPINMKCYYLLICLLCLCCVQSNATEAANNENDFERLMNSSDENSLPLINITADINAITKEEYITGEVEVFDKKCRTDSMQYVKMACKVKYRGASSLIYDKKSFALKTLDENGKKADVNMFGIREDDSWILDAMAIDRLRMRNRVCFDIWNDIDKTPYDTDYENRNGTKGLFVEVFLNGDYHGLYCFTDKINRKLLGLKKVKENKDGSISVRGVLYKGNAWTEATLMLGYDNTASVDTDTWNGWELQHPDDYPSAEAWQPLMDLIDFYQSSDDAYVANYKEHLYKDHMMNFVVLLMATNYKDCVLKNTFLSIPDITQAQKFLITPWDMDMSLGGNYDGSYYDVLFQRGDIANLQFFRGLLKDDGDGFKTAVSQKWRELSQSVVATENVNKRIDDYVEQLTSSGAWQREYDKWNGNPVPLYQNLADEASYVKDWYVRNYQNVCDIMNVETGITNVNYTMEKRFSPTYSIDGTRMHDGEKRAKKQILIRSGKKYINK